METLSLIGDEEVISLSNAKVYVFSDSVLCFGKMSENPQSKTVWEDKLTWFKSWTQLMVSQWNSSGKFPRIHHIAALLHKVQEFLSNMSVEPEDFTGRMIFMSMFNCISWGSKNNAKECESNANLVSLCAKRFGAGRWSFLGPGSEKKWYSTQESKL